MSSSPTRIDHGNSLEECDMGKKHAILWLAVATLIAGTADAAKLVRHYRFQNPSNLGQAKAN